MDLQELRENLKQISVLQDAPDDFCEALADQVSFLFNLKFNI